ncbi:MAG: aminoacyl-tRNA deacylase [Planctomycetota bacterium]|jgi:Ala-tRNA(Pro) deacylase
MLVREKLNHEMIRYEELHHRPTFTSQHLAQAEHVHGMNVAKPVIVNADGQFYMCVLPACCHISLDAIRSALDAGFVRLANEGEMPELFPDCEVGAEPPFGSLYGMPTVLDDRLDNSEFIVFQSGTHDEAIKISMQDYLKIETPRVFSFSKHM